MKLLFRIFLFFTFVVFYKATFLQAIEYNEVYKIEVKKINIGKLFWNVSYLKDSYSIHIKLEDKGIFSSLYNFKGEYKTIGNIKNDKLFPINYKQNWITKKKKREVKIFFEKNLLIKIKQLPIEKEFARINLIGLKNYLDPLSSFLNLLKEKDNLKTIDGRRTYSLVFDLATKNKNEKTKKIIIDNYNNIWSDHKRIDLEYIEITQTLGEEIITMPTNIKIKFKGILFKLTKI